MKGIYLTRESKLDIESKIDELQKELQLVDNLFEDVVHNHNYISTKINVYKDILESATILPVVNNWDYILNSYKSSVLEYYPKGVIIKY
jgi:hypothetical protein